MEAQEYARAALDMMTREIRNAGFFPTGAACTDVANTAGIVSADTSATQIHLVYDFRSIATPSPADGDCGDPGENITYNFTGNVATNTPGDITRDAADGTGPQPLTAGNVTALTFTYFDATGALITVPANIAPLAKRVLISLTVRSNSTDASFGGGQLITMTSNVDLRNRCITPTCAQM
jgi:Tfp pilus assembly protein PilW